jgi:transposase
MGGGKRRERNGMTKRQPTYTDEFKRKMVELHETGKTVSELSREYGIAKSTISKWEREYTSTGSFKAGDNRSEEETELRKLRKENKKLRMEIDILKQAALILGRNAE